MKKSKYNMTVYSNKSFDTLPQIITICCAIIIGICCFFPFLAPDYAEKGYTLRNISNNYIFVLPVFILLNSCFDGLWFLRYKFTFVLGLIGVVILFYFHCRFHFEGLSYKAYSIYYYISFFCYIVVMFLPFFIKDCDNSGLIHIGKFDYIWIVFFAAVGIFFLLKFNSLKNPVMLYIISMIE